MDYINKSPTALSLCPGIRGLERGVERVTGKINVLAYVEIEAFIIENLVTAMDAGILAPAPVWTDVKTFPAEIFRGKVDWLFGGYPCQPFSVAGKQKGTEDPRHLWPYIEKHIDVIRPGGCFLENVPGHLNIGYREVRQSLEEMGYSIKEGIYSAEEVGAPHERKRLFILALDHTHRSEPGKRPGNNGEMFEIPKEQWAKFSAALFDGTGSELANSPGIGMERNGTKGKQVSGISIGETIPGRDSGRVQWPAGQGEYQHEWEEPRTIESGMGCTIDGYNFREDLLRALGNSVVEQTAELAFMDLLNKHINQWQKV